MNLVLEIRLVPKEMGKFLLQSVFAFPRRFFYSVSAPLDSAYPYFRVSGPSGDSVENQEKVLRDIVGLAVDLSFLLAHVLLRVPSNIFLAVRCGIPDVYLTFLLAVPNGMLLLQLSSELGMVQCTEGLIFLIPEIFGFLEWVIP